MLFNIPHNISNNSGVYSITNSHDNRFYIGSTVCFKKRFQDHKSHLITKTHANKYLQSFVNKHGIRILSFNILYPCKNTCLVYNEKLLIDSLKPQFNIKKIVNRPYFDDEIRFNTDNMIKHIEEINRKIELKYFKIVDKQIEPIENYNILPF